MVKLMIEKILGVKIKLSSARISQDDSGKVKKGKAVEAAESGGQQRQELGVEVDLTT